MGREGKGRRGLPAEPPACCGFSLCPEQDEVVVRVAQVARPGWDSSDLSKEAGLVDLAESVLEVHGERASVFLGRGDSSRNHQLHGMQVVCHVFHRWTGLALKMPERFHCWMTCLFSRPSVRSVLQCQSGKH